MAKLTDEQAKLFLDKNLGVVATIRKDGTPQLTPVWIDYDGENVLFNTAEGRWKPRNIQRDPRVTVFVQNPGDPWQWISITGPVETTRDGAVEHIDKLAKKYTGRDSYGVKPGEQRVIVSVRPERVNALGFD
jgi:PPOX class probable F420-dependent enzyme